MMDAIAICLGYTLIVSTGVCIAAIVLIGSARMMNRAQHSLLESIGGWKTFLEYRRWYHAKNEMEED